jgi:hypothetical protein
MSTHALAAFVLDQLASQEDRARDRRHKGKRKRRCGRRTRRGAEMKRLATAATDFVEGAARNVANGPSMLPPLLASRSFTTSLRLARSRPSAGRGARLRAVVAFGRRGHLSCGASTAEEQ